MGFTDLLRKAHREGHMAHDTVEALVTRMRAVLVRELHRRGLWWSSPRYLGIVGSAHWDGDALSDLVNDCYIFVFVHRLRGLRAQLEVKDNIEGLVLRSVRNFLFEAQKRHDPIGYKVYDRMRSAVRATLDRGSLHILAGDRRIGNDTVLGTCDAATLSSADVLCEHTVSWCEDLLPQLITANGRGVHRVLRRLEVHLEALPSRGVVSFRFQDLVSALKREVRIRWRAIAAGDGRTRGASSIGDGVTGFEDRQRFARLMACVALAMGHRDAKDRSRTYLWRLWVFLCAYASESPVAELDGSVFDIPDELPSERGLATALGIPRARLHGLRHEIGEMVGSCRDDAVDAKVVR